MAAPLCPSPRVAETVMSLNDKKRTRRVSEDSMLPPLDRARWALAIVLSMTILIAPPVWNHFPLLQYDTGGYLARWYEGTLVPSRAVVYGLILNLGVPLSFWPVVLG